MVKPLILSQNYFTYTSDSKAQNLQTKNLNLNTSAKQKLHPTNDKGVTSVAIVRNCDLPKAVVGGLGLRV